MIAGSAKGRRLLVPAVAGIRPTLSRIREPLFDILGDRLNGSAVMDLFAGSGALGIEALSRGARSAVFVEENPACLRAISENLMRCGFMANAHVVRGTLPESISRVRGIVTEKLDTVFMDPPYGSAWNTSIFEKLDRFSLLEGNATIVLEHFHKDAFQSLPDVFSLREQRRYGDTVLTFFDYLPMERDPQNE